MANTNLRDLLGIVTTDSIVNAAAADTVTKVPAYPSKGYCVHYITSQCGATCEDYTTQYHYYCYPAWDIPDNTTDVIFEVWGAGGGGGVGCCCSRAIPGSSGAYAYKRLSGSDIVAGCSYVVNIGVQGCGRNNICGQQGGPTYITGHNLTNFCADGGYGGCSCCTMCCCTWFVVDPSGRSGNPGINQCWGGSCAQYYGADGGAYGNAGASYMWHQSDHCFNKQWIPYPGGLINGKGGWSLANQCRNSGCGMEEECMAMHHMGWGGSSERNYIPGMGGVSGWMCTDGGCTGRNGMPGMVRISYKMTDPNA